MVHTCGQIRHRAAAPAVPSSQRTRDNPVFRKWQNHVYHTHKRYRRRTRKVVSLNFEEYRGLMFPSGDFNRPPVCAICRACPGDTIDRVDTRILTYVNNAQPACKRCNNLKGNNDSPQPKGMYIARKVNLYKGNWFNMPRGISKPTNRRVNLPNARGFIRTPGKGIRLAKLLTTTVKKTRGVIRDVSARHPGSPGLAPRVLFGAPTANNTIPSQPQRALPAFVPDYISDRQPQLGRALLWHQPQVGQRGDWQPQLGQQQSLLGQQQSLLGQQQSLLGQQQQQLGRLPQLGPHQSQPGRGLPLPTQQQQFMPGAPLPAAPTYFPNAARAPYPAHPAYLPAPGPPLPAHVTQQPAVPNEVPGFQRADAILQGIMDTFQRLVQMRSNMSGQPGRQ